MKAKDHLRRELSIGYGGSGRDTMNHLWNAIGRSILMALRDLDEANWPGMLKICVHKKSKTDPKLGIVRLRLSNSARRDLKVSILEHNLATRVTVATTVKT